jgi:hypothetical protein
VDLATYTEPVSGLLTHGEADWDEWDDYSAYGFSSENIPELIRLGTDRHLLIDEDVDDAALWAPLHAWRVLATLFAPEAIPPLVRLLALSDEADSDLISEGLQDVLVSLGPPAIDELAGFLLEVEDGNGGSVGAAETLALIGIDHPEERDRIVQILSATFEARYAANDPMINGFLVSDLLDLHAAESYPIIKAAYEAGAVDPMVSGDLEDVEIDLGLKKMRTKPRPLTPFQRDLGLEFEPGLGNPDLFPFIIPSKAAKKEKAKRKQEKRSRHKNRKRK